MLLQNDCEKGEGVDLARKYEVRVYPTFAMVDDAGETTDRWAGYGGVEAFGAQVEAALADRATIDEKRRRYEAEPTLALARSLAQYSEAVFANAEAVDYYRTIMELDPGSAAEVRQKIVIAMYYGLRDDQYTVDQLAGEARSLLDDHGDDLDQVMLVENIMKMAAPPAAYVPFLERALAASAAAVPEDDEDAEAIADYRRRLAVDEALLIRRDRPLALRLQRELLPEGWRDDPSQVHRFAWWCLQNDLNLEEAHRLAVEAAENSTDDLGRAGILGTAAGLAFKLGDLQRAVAHQTRAVELAPARERYRQQLARYEEARDAEAGEVRHSGTGEVYADRLTVAIGDRTATLQFTGAGLRQRTFLKVDVYSLASYVSAGVDLSTLAEAPGGPAEALRTLPVARRLQMDLRRDVSRQQLVDSLSESIARNYADTAAFAGDLETFLAFFDRDAVTGDRIVFDYLPGLGLATSLNGEVVGIVPGDTLSEVLWTVWLGEKPADGQVKKGLLAGISS